MSVTPAPADHIAVYVHIPFCRSRCRYCDFYFETGSSERVRHETLSRILDEATYFMCSLGFPRVDTVYVGGGTPSVIPAGRLAAFLGDLADRLGIDGACAEWTLEANPESVTEEFLQVIEKTPVTRLSVGVQTFEDRLLRLLGRRAHREQIDRALEALKAHWTGRLSVDLIAGIPTQSHAELLADVDRLLVRDPDHISVYALSIEPRTPLAQAIDAGWITPLPAGEHERRWIAARDRLQEAGYAWYEVSNFARPGEESRHNCAYWRLDPYIGLGPSGTGTIPARSETGIGVARLTNPDLFRYASRQDRSWSHEVEWIEPGNLLFEHFMLGLRTVYGISLERLRRVFAIEPDTLIPAVAGGWEGWDYVEPAALENGRIVLSPRGRLVLDRLLISLFEIVEELPLRARPAWP